MWKVRLAAVFIFLAGLGLGYFVYTTEQAGDTFKFRLGLDLAGGTHLVYHADTSDVPEGEVPDAMQALRDVIERRVNSQSVSGAFGVLDPIVQTEQSSLAAGKREQRLIVELPGVTDTEQAINFIGETPILEFKLLQEGVELPGSTTTPANINYDQYFTDTGLTGRFVEGAQLTFGSLQSGQQQNEPIVLVNFNSEGADRFEEITRANVGRILGIFLDGELRNAPVIREPIPGGQATISGGFDVESARDLVRNLNFGASPVPIELRSVQTIGASLGATAVDRGLHAALWGLGFVALFMLLWYRAAGVVSVVSLGIYIAIMLSLFKLIPVTLTAAGIAGFILSIGMAVDANVLIFERMKEEIRRGKTLPDAIREGFARAWLAIRDGNLSSIITAIILFWFGTSLVEGFALVFGLGVVISMFSAITVSRTILLACALSESRISRALFDSGISTRKF